MIELPASYASRRQLSENARVILYNAHVGARSFLGIFGTIRSARSARGTPTDEEQDLLRAMVVFAGAGLDSMTKQLIRDTLPEMLNYLPEARERIEKLSARLLQGGARVDIDENETGGTLGVNARRLAGILLADDPRAVMVELLVDNLTAGSLQSVPELYRVLEYLGVDPKTLGTTEHDLREVFQCRNRIIHEMDIDFAQPNRNRFPRRRDDMAS